MARTRARTHTLTGVRAQRAGRSLPALPLAHMRAHALLHSRGFARAHTHTPMSMIVVIIIIVTQMIIVVISGLGGERRIGCGGG
jgi:hypothetical protein